MAIHRKLQLPEFSSVKPTKTKIKNIQFRPAHSRRGRHSKSPGFTADPPRKCWRNQDAICVPPARTDDRNSDSQNAGGGRGGVGFIFDRSNSLFAQSGSGLS